MERKFSGMKVELGGYEARAVFPTIRKEKNISTSHIHFDIELHFVLSGAFKVVTEGTELILPENSVCIIPKGISHDTFCITENSKTFNMLVSLKPVRSKELYKKLQVWENLNDIQVFEDCDIINGYIRDFIVALQRRDGAGEYITRSFFTLVILNITDRIEQRFPCKSMVASACSINYGGEFFDAELENFLMTNYRRKLLRSEVAEHIGISTAQLGRILLKNYGMSFNQLITELRMKDAKKMIIQDNTLAEIAKSLGYTTYNGFANAFRRTYGMTPEQMKKEEK